MSLNYCVLSLLSHFTTVSIQNIFVPFGPNETLMFSQKFGKDAKGYKKLHIDHLSDSTCTTTDFKQLAICSKL